MLVRGAALVDRHVGAAEGDASGVEAAEAALVGVEAGEVVAFKCKCR